MQNNTHPLGNIPLSTFLQEFWQQKPLLIRNAIENYKCPISADEMAGLACEPDVESRIILEHDGDHPWQCQHGPFDESLFSQLPETHWTLLLQSCNVYIDTFAKLLEQFRFIPNWRVDDVMVSYAPPGGSVGPHTDNYDVFLLQAQGKRRWEISTDSYTEADFYPDLDLKILRLFKPEESWELEPGDMLYLPPGVAHHGVALNDCITISIGFRAPNEFELSTALLDEVLSQQTTKNNIRFYRDPDFPLQDNPGEISAWALQRINNMVSQALSSRIQNSDWFGKYITEAGESTEPPESMQVSNMTQQRCFKMLEQGQQLVRNECAKLAFFRNEEDRIHFFCNGVVACYPIELLDLITIVCNNRYPSIALLIKALDNNETKLFLYNLIKQGHFYFEKDCSDSD